MCCSTWGSRTGWGRSHGESGTRENDVRRAWRETWWTAGYKAQQIECVCVIQKVQKREAYFDCTAAPGDSCGALSRAVLPSFSSPASPVRPRSRPEMAGAAGLRRSSGGSSRRRSAHPQSRCRPSGAGLVRQRPYGDLSLVNPEPLGTMARYAYQTAGGSLAGRRPRARIRVGRRRQTSFRS